MKEAPKFRITGAEVSKEWKEAIHERLQAIFTENLDSLPEEKRQVLLEHELRMEGRQIALVSFANLETNRLLQEAGMEPFDILPERCHLVPDRVYQDVLGYAEDSDASADVSHGRMYLSEERNAGLVVFGLTVLHEMMHLKAHQSLHATNTPNGGFHIAQMREGLLMRPALQGEVRHEHFRGLNEAVVAMRERLSFMSLLDVPEISAQKELYLSPEEVSQRETIAERNNISPDDISWIGTTRDGKEYTRLFSYIEPCATLRFICEEIQSTHPESFTSWEQVFKKFENAHFNGKLIELGKLVESTFGAGSFRLIGDMGADGVSARACAEALRGRRGLTD